MIIDNYDSFTYNLVQLFESRGATTQVVLNDQISIEEIKRLNPDGIILSPGPCTPLESGICIDIVKELSQDYPILGVCLGHQVIGHVYGANVRRASKIIHGKLDKIGHSGHNLFENIEQGFLASRYHSLIVEKRTLPSTISITASALSDGEIMAMAHREHPVYGLQFHPESYGTEYGSQIADNFIKIMLDYKGGK